MGCWLCITTKENWEVIKSRKVWGVTDRHKEKLDKTGKGDTLIFYVIMHREGDEIVPPQVVGFAKVASSPYRSSTKVFKPVKGGEIFPNRVNLEDLEVLDKPVNFKKLVPKLEFIKNKKAWYGSLMGRAMIKLSKKDCSTLLNATKKGS